MDITAKPIKVAEEKGNFEREIACCFRVFLDCAEQERRMKLTKRLIESARGGDLEEMRIQISQGGDINGFGKEGGTPLMEAIIYSGVDKAGFGRAMVFFKEMGADFNAQHKISGFSALHWMVFLDYSPFILERVIKEYNLDVKIRDSMNRTPREMILSMDPNCNRYKAVAQCLRQFEV